MRARPPAPARRPAEHVPSLDVLRGLMAVMVAMYHFASWTHVFEGGTRLSSAMATLGIYAVEGFFIISGFCFFHLYAGQRMTPREVAHFSLRRYARIAPLYYTAVLANLVLGQPVSPNFSWRRLLENLTLSFGFFHPNHSMVHGGWSIGIEYVFYVAFPLLAWLTMRRSLLYITALGLMALAYPAIFPSSVPESIFERFHGYVAISNHAFLFLLGGVIADLRKHTHLRLPGWALLISIAGLGWLWLRDQRVFYDHYDVMAGMARVRCLVACFLLVLAFALHPLSRRALMRPLVGLGELSYSIYLLHPFAWLLVSKVARNATPAVLFGAGLVLSIGLAFASHRLIEKPAIGLGRAWTRATPKRAALGTDPAERPQSPATSEADLQGDLNIRSAAR